MHVSLPLLRIEQVIHTKPQQYYRIPISPDRPIEDNYLDAYLRVIRETDPTKTALVFCCGMGAVRTTFAMVATELVRRKQIMDKGGPDPYGMPVGAKGALTPVGLSSSPGTLTVLYDPMSAS